MWDGEPAYEMMLQAGLGERVIPWIMDGEKTGVLEPVCRFIWSYLRTLFRMVFDCRKRKNAMTQTDLV